MDVSATQIRRFLSNHKRREIKKPGLIHAGVLVLLFPGEKGLNVLLTKRTSDVEHHKGQISFPGGSVDEGDRDIVATALREMQEEIGLKPDLVEILGVFDDAWTPSGFRITPVIGYVSKLPSLQPSAVEVEEILHVPVSLFLDPTKERVKNLERAGEKVEVYFYKFGEKEIWGATAGMLRSFLHALAADVARKQ